MLVEKVEQLREFLRENLSRYTGQPFERAEMLVNSTPGVLNIWTAPTLAAALATFPVNEFKIGDLIYASDSGNFYVTNDGVAFVLDNVLENWYHTTVLSVKVTFYSSTPAPALVPFLYIATDNSGYNSGWSDVISPESIAIDGIQVPKYAEIFTGSYVVAAMPGPLTTFLRIGGGSFDSSSSY